ncbi:hypothetical protein ABZ370_31885 [Streptomyces sp. NPDC005962]|uniref:hypothetical protein n=1 Tax=Streptomyces sp. NPDC005962 TaxID=3154466 RepID=UPI0034047236
MSGTQLSWDDAEDEVALDVVADVLGAAPEVAAVVLSRFREAASAAVLSRIA